MAQIGVNLHHLGYILEPFFHWLCAKARRKKAASVLNYFGGFISDQVILWKRDFGQGAKLALFIVIQFNGWPRLGRNWEQFWEEKRRQKISISCRNVFFSSKSKREVFSIFERFVISVGVWICDGPQSKKTAVKQWTEASLTWPSWSH